MARSTLGLASAAAFLAASGYTDAFSVPSQSNFVSTKTKRSSFAFPSLLTNNSIRPSTHHSSTSLAVLSKEQALHTAERLAGMSRGEIQHIFEDLDADGSGAIDLAELDLLAKYFPGETFTPEVRAKLMKEIDTDGNGEIDAEEFYQWMVVNAKSDGSADSKGTKQMQMRQARLEVGKDGIDPHLMELLDELGVGAVVQKVTHPLHSAFGRTLYDHFVSCYLISKEWGNPEFVAVANLFHALYQRGDGMRAVDFTEYRPKLQEKLGKDVEQLIYLFPSAHKSALLADGILMAPVGEDIEVPNVLEGGMVTIPKELRPYLVDMEVINSHDQHVLENSNPVHNLWSFYQHATVMPIMSEGARESIIEYQKRGAGASVADVLNWHEGRFADGGKEIPELWQKHLELFRAPDGKFVCVEENLKRLADKDGDGEIDWDEFVSADFQQCFV
eukprot:scaffold21369_cov153-Skeletonema_dohrnii-CCMP3373.AAC.2